MTKINFADGKINFDIENNYIYLIGLTQIISPDLSHIRVGL